MLELKTKQKLSSESHNLAVSFQLVRYRNNTYMPADYETGATDVTPPPERTMWIPLNRDRIRRQAAAQYDTLFATESELSSFDFMVAQNAWQYDGSNTTLLVRTGQGLRELRGDGKLHDPTGVFVPNTLTPMLCEDVAEKERVFNVISGWLNSDEEAHALLHHFATALAPGWSAVRYVLLLGEGRNGKSVLLKMMHKLFGGDNVSHVSRQDIAEKSAVVTELNGKLLNLVYDGQSSYLKDSGLEKTLIAGEMGMVRKLYESTPTPVQTNALFVEGLNREPKSNDKSTALQKRLMRFQFPNVYAQDHKFERLMLEEKSIGALLSLLIDHYVLEDEVAEKLAPTTQALALQLEHMFTNSLGLQFLKYIEDADPMGTAGLVGEDVSLLAEKFASWRIKENDLGQWSEPDILALFNPVVNTERKSKRINNQPRKVRVITSFKPEAVAFIESLKEEEDDVAALVED